MREAWRKLNHKERERENMEREREKTQNQLLTFYYLYIYISIYLYILHIAETEYTYTVTKREHGYLKFLQKGRKDWKRWWWWGRRCQDWCSWSSLSLQLKVGLKNFWNISLRYVSNRDCVVCLLRLARTRFRPIDDFVVDSNRSYTMDLCFWYIIQTQSIIHSHTYILTQPRDSDLKVRTTTTIPFFFRVCPNRAIRKTETEMFSPMRKITWRVKDIL